MTFTFILIGLISAFSFPVDQITVTKLDNGLEIYTLEDHSAPLVAFQVWYRAGSRNESIGNTGIAHLVEHMMFKGTPNLRKGEFSATVSRYGGNFNAWTSEDNTTYFETFASDRYELSLKLEADRMREILMVPEEFYSERDVVNEERRIGDDRPMGSVYQAISATAFWAHPYRWPVIGWESDITQVTREDGWNFYRSVYRPNNAYIVAVGDFITSEFIEQVKLYFGDISAGDPIPPIRTQEPEQKGERRVTIEREAQIPYLVMGFHTPQIGHADYFALEVLSRLFSGGRSSRLYKELVYNQKLVTWISAQYWGDQTDPTLFAIMCGVKPEVSPEVVEKAIWAEIAKIISDGPESKELTRVINNAEADFIRRRESFTGMSSSIGSYNLRNALPILQNYVDSLRAVDGADVQFVTKQYLTKRNASIITLIPTQETDTPDEVAFSEDVMQYCAYFDAYEEAHSEGANADFGNNPFTKIEITSKAKERVQNSLVRAEEIYRQALANGVTQLVLQRDKVPTVEIGLRFLAGSVYDPPGKTGLANLTAAMMNQGTKSLSAVEFAEKIENVAGSLYAGSGSDFAYLRLSVLKKDLKLGLDMMNDMLLNPAFLEEEFNRKKEEIIASIKSSYDDPNTIASENFDRLLYGMHPYGSRISGTVESVTNITLQDVKEFYNQYYKADNALIGVVGDVNRDLITEQLNFTFAAWEKSNSPASAISAPTPITTSSQKTEIKDNLSQTTLMYGVNAIARNDKDYLAYSVMNYILGGSSLSSRLGRKIRDELGLVYHVSSRTNTPLLPGSWYVYLATKNESAIQALAAVKEEIARMIKDGITEAELLDAKEHYSGMFPLQQESNGALLGFIMDIEWYTLGMDYIETYLKKLNNITIEDVNKVTKRILANPNWVTVMVGNPIVN